MNRVELNFKTFDNHPKGYGLSSSYSEQEAFERVYNYLQDRKDKYIKHFIISKWVENSDYGLYDPPSTFNCPPIPKGDLIYTIVLYYESCK